MGIILTSICTPPPPNCPIGAAEHCCICIRGRAFVERSFTCVWPQLPWPWGMLFMQCKQLSPPPPLISTHP